MGTTHPLISSGKMKKEQEAYNKKISDYITKITTPIFAKKLGVPQEELSNSITTTKKPFKYFFRPNNWRRQIEVKEKTNSTINHLKKVNPAIKPNPHTKLISLKEGNIIIQYGKKTLTAIYSCPVIRGVKQGWTIERDTQKEAFARMDKIKEKIRNELDNTLNKFSKQFDILLPFKQPIWGRHEDFIKGESYIDRIPKECQFVDTVCKKVYPEVGIEFVGGKGEEPTLKTKTYLKNRAIEDIAPDIAASLNQLNSRFDTMGNKIMDMMDNRMKVDKELAINIKTHNKVFKKLDNLLTTTKLRKKYKGKSLDKDLRKWL